MTLPKIFPKIKKALPRKDIPMLLTIAKITITVLDIILAYLMFSSASDAGKRRDADTGAVWDTQKVESVSLSVVGVLHLVNAALLWA